MNDDLVKQYKETGKSEELLNAYRFFLLKYYMMFRRKQIDFENYDIRQFLACYIRNPEYVRSLRRGPKYHSADARAAAYRMLYRIVKVFEGYDWAKIPKDYTDTEVKDFIPYDDLYNELAMVFLTCAWDYEDQGVGFHRYIYKMFRYRLKHHIDSKMYDAGDSGNANYSDMMHAGQRVPFVESLIDSMERPLQLQEELETDLNNENWFNGYGCGELFKDLSYAQRKILVKFYECGYKDKEIAKEVGYNPVYLGQIRRDLVEQFRDKWKRGEIKWLR
jgi:hypothetical protein